MTIIGLSLPNIVRLFVLNSSFNRLLMLSYHGSSDLLLAQYILQRLQYILQRVQVTVILNEKKQLGLMGIQTK